MSLHLTRYQRWMVSLGFFILFLLSIILFIVDWTRFLYTPLIPKNTSIDYILPSGASVRLLAADLTQLGLLDRPDYFIALAYLKGYARHLRAGEYRFTAGTRPDDILHQVANGQVLWRQVTFIEGWTFNQILDALENNPLIVHKLAGLPPVIIMLNLGIPGTNPEGLFFPDSYRYTAGMSDKAILMEAYQTMQMHLAEEWKNRASNLPYPDSYQALIVASIIEKEAQRNSERPKIAGVILERLAKKMLLQMDSTVIYALGSHYQPPLVHADLSIDSPYNTYHYAGLPPTPIAMPGLASIHAALHPVLANDLYFVARGDGSHQFSETYQQHKQAIIEYQRNK